MLRCQQILIRFRMIDTFDDVVEEIVNRVDHLRESLKIIPLENKLFFYTSDLLLIYTS